MCGLWKSIQKWVSFSCSLLCSHCYFLREIRAKIHFKLINIVKLIFTYEHIGHIVKLVIGTYWSSYSLIRSFLPTHWAPLRALGQSILEALQRHVLVAFRHSNVEAVNRDVFWNLAGDVLRDYVAGDVAANRCQQRVNELFVLPAVVVIPLDSLPG